MSCYEGHWLWQSALSCPAQELRHKLSYLMRHQIKWVCKLWTVWSLLTPWRGPPFTCLCSIPSCLHPILDMFFICSIRAFWYMPYTYFSIFQMMVGDRSADGAGQRPVLLRKGHAILRSSQESQPSLVCWERHLAFPSSFPAWGLFWHPCWSIAALLCNEVTLSSLCPVPSPPVPSFTSLPPEPWASAHLGDSPSAASSCHQPLAFSSFLLYQPSLTRLATPSPESVNQCQPHLWPAAMSQAGAHTFPLSFYPWVLA